MMKFLLDRLAPIFQLRGPSGGIRALVVRIIVQDGSLKRPIKDSDRLHHETWADFLQLKGLVHNLEVPEPDLVVGGDGEGEDVVDERLRSGMVIRGPEGLQIIEVFG